MTQAVDVRPRWCPHCGTALVVASDGERERRGCRRCGWIYEPPTTLAVVAVVEYSDRIVVIGNRPTTLPMGTLAWAEDPESAALRIAHTQTGLHPSDPHFLGFLHTPSENDPQRFVLTFCYVLQSETPVSAALASVELARLHEVGPLSRAGERYALDAYRAWLERQV